MSESERLCLKNSSAAGLSPGGRVTISPPSKQSSGKDTGVQILCANVDTLHLSLNIVWKETDFFERLADIKQAAETEGREKAALFVSPSKEKEFLFNVKGHGAKGYEWILDNSEYLLNIGNWYEPKSRPSVMVYIKSETLWLQGPKQAVKNILAFISEQKGIIRDVKLSRVDLCMDTLFPENLWEKNIFDYRVTQSTYGAMHFYHTHLTGITFGKGVLSARLYDKFIEIKQSSQKTWMFEIWGYDQPPKGKKIIRIEFQVRREAIKQLGLDKYSDLFRLQKNLWKYCTGVWLKFQDNPGRKSHQRKTFPWWIEVQNGLSDSSSAYPLIRCQAMSQNQEQLYCQANGMLSSMAALFHETNHSDFDSVVTMEDQINYFTEHAVAKGIKSEDITEAVRDKRAKYRRTEEKIKNVRAQRKQLGLT